MQHRIAIAAVTVTALIIGACADQGDGSSRFSTEPGGEGGRAPVATSYFTRGVAAVVDPRTHRLHAITQSAAPSNGVSASIVAGGTGSTLLLPAGSPGLAKSAGYYTMKYTDQSNRTHTVNLLYGTYGGPPAALQHYVNGVLKSTTGYSWQKVSTGWLRTSSITRVLQSGALVATYSTTTTATTSSPTSTGGTTTGPAIPVRLEHPPESSGARRMLSSFAYGLAFALAPRDASAQTSLAFAACEQEWLKYAAAAAIVVGLEAVVIDAPILTPLLLSQLVSALALLGVAEDQLLNCVIAHQPGTLASFGSAGGGIGASGGDFICLSGSYAASCTTPFTL